jgi:hypothetical protein
MLLTKPVHDACLVEIVGGYLKFEEVARGKADEPLPHLSRDVNEYEMFISKRDPKHRGLPESTVYDLSTVRHRLEHVFRCM